MSAPTNASPAIAEITELSKQYDTPLGLAHTTMQALKDRIKLHYDLASDYYLNLWGEHIHHGYWPTDESKATDTKETAQLNLIRLLLDMASLPSADAATSSTTTTDAPPIRVLDVGCGIGGTARFLASALPNCAVTGITISGKQVQMATRLSRSASEHQHQHQHHQQQQQRQQTDDDDDDDAAFIPIGSQGGRVRFLELDAEQMGDYFLASSSSSFSSSDDDSSSSSGSSSGKFDVVWISEALSHLPDKAGVFRDARRLLRPGGRLVLADWFRAEGLGEAALAADIKPIEDGMLLPPLCTQQGYIDLATGAGLALLNGPKDISKDVSKTWDISWSLVQNPSLWAFAFSQGRDGIAFLQAFRAMRRGYANGTFRYAVMSFVKP